LPLECRPRKLVDASDLSEYAMDLMRASCDSPEPSPLRWKNRAGRCSLPD